MQIAWKSRTTTFVKHLNQSIFAKVSLRSINTFYNSDYIIGHLFRLRDVQYFHRCGKLSVNLNPAKYFITFLKSKHLTTPELNVERKAWTWCDWKLRRKICASNANLQRKVRAEKYTITQIMSTNECRPGKNGSVDGTDES